MPENERMARDEPQHAAIRSARKAASAGFNKYAYVVAAAAVAFLLLASHIFSFLIENIKETVFHDAERPLLVCLFISSLILLSLVLGKYSKRIALLCVISSYVVFYFSFIQYSIVASFLHEYLQDYLGITLRNGAIALAILIVLVVVPFYIFLRIGADRSLLLVGAFAVASTATALVNYKASHAGIGDETVVLQGPALELSADKAPYPDIFYIVPDRYGNVEGLKHLFGFDNAQFVRELKRRGFYVAEDAYANYPQTAWSLASSLNMAYLDVLTEKYGRNEENQLPLYHLIEDNNVQSLLRQLGYRYVHTASQWRGTLWNKHADVNFSAVSRIAHALKLTEVEIKLLNMTPFAAIMRRFDYGAYPGCERIRHQIDFIKNAGGQAKPTFVFAHVMIPHEPIFLDQNAKCIEPTGYERLPWPEFGQAFIGYLKYGNTALLDIIDHQLKNNPNDVIFIIQADEGPYPRSVREKRDTYMSLSDRDMAAKLGILNAIYIPKSNYRRFYPSLSPINDWRLVFSHLLGRDLELLEDRSYVFTDSNRAFDFRDVTDRLHERQHSR